MGKQEAQSREEWMRRALESAPPLSDAAYSRLAELLPPVTDKELPASPHRQAR